MLNLIQSVKQWDEVQFSQTLQTELEQNRQYLPLQQALAYGSYVVDTPLSIMLYQCTKQAEMLQVKVGVFYQSIIAGCSCADDPTPVGELSEYCVLILHINPLTGGTRVELLE